MPRPRPDGGVPRRPVPLRLSPLEEAPVRALADREHGGVLGPALRAAIVAGVRPHLPISEAGAAALDQLAAETGLTREQVGKLALTFAVQRTRHWLPRPGTDPAP